MDKAVEKQAITLPRDQRFASGRPGVEPRWTSGAKTMVGTATSGRSRVWFTVNNGVLAETYFPDVDRANTRAMRFLITGEDGFFSDEVWDADHTVTWLEEGVPGCRIETREKSGRYTLRKEILTDPLCDALLMQVSFTPAPGQQLRLYLSADPHVGDQGADNHGWAGQYKGIPMLFACRRELAISLALDPPSLRGSVGYIGTTDAYTVLSQGKPLPDTNIARPGNVSLAAEVDLGGAMPDDAGAHHFLVALACGADAAEAGQQARVTLLRGYEVSRQRFVEGWQGEQAKYKELTDLSGLPLNMYRVSTAVLETHQSKRFPGGFVASLSLPWGFAQSDKDVGGYHVVWPRDLVEVAMGKLAAGDADAARSTLFFLACTQNEDGGWSQNMWLDGTPHWNAVQMDGIAWPLLLADRLQREGALDGYNADTLVQAAARFIVQHGPVTEQDRWENAAGYSPYTMAVQIAALLVAADWAEQRNEPGQASFLRETADAWNDAVDELTYVRGTALATAHGVTGCYLRIAPDRRIELAGMGNLRIKVPNRPLLHRYPRAVDVVSPDALALVRFGLRAADDPKILDTVRVLDATLKHEMATGPGWRRASDDGYGEKADGSPYVKTGIGRCWPLLAGERGHYELAAGRRDAALHLLQTMARQTSECGMLPEQVWDAPDIPARELFNGHPSGSGMPLAWAHAEYIKLLRSLHENAVWDAVPQTTARYVHARHPASFQIWTPKQRRACLQRGKDLRIDLLAPARVTWRVSGRTKASSTSNTLETTDTQLGLHVATLPLAALNSGAAVRVRIEPLRRGQGKPDAFLIHVHEAPDA